MPNNNPAKLAKLRMPDYSGSWWQMRPKELTTMPVGKWVPISVMDIAGNSLVKIKPSMRYEGLPQLSPLYGGWTQRTKYYFVPYRLYMPNLRKNRQLDWGTIPEQEIPTLLLQHQGIFAGPDENYDGYYSETYDDFISNNVVSLSGSLLDRLNMVYGELCFGQSLNNKDLLLPGVNELTTDILNVTLGFKGTTNLVPLLAYIDAWLYGEYNPQDENIPVDYDRIIYDFEEFESPKVARVVETTWTTYDSLRDFVDAFAYGTLLTGGGGLFATKTALSSQLCMQSVYGDFSPAGLFRKDAPIPYRLVENYPVFTRVLGRIFEFFGGGLADDGRFPRQFWDSLRNTSSTVGLLPVTYKGDYFTSWFSTEGVNRLKNYTVKLGQSLLQLRKSNSDMFIEALSMISGDRWVDYLQWVFDTDLELKDHPILIGFDEVDFGGIDVINNADTATGATDKGSTNILGATANKITEYNRSVRPMSVKTKEPGLIMVCSSIVPNVYYYQGTPRFMNYRTLADVWHPQYQKMGFEELQRGEYYNPFAIGKLDQTSNFYYWSHPDGDELAGENVQVDSVNTLNEQAVSWVPLGWEYMQRPSRLSGSMKTPQFKTWSLHREFDSSHGTYIEGDPDNFPQGFVDEDSEEYFNPILESGIDYMKSTYIDSGAYNYMFANNSKAGSNNFIVRFEFDMSVYQPLSHTLMDKQGV